MSKWIGQQQQRGKVTNAMRRLILLAALLISFLFLPLAGEGQVVQTYGSLSNANQWSNTNTFQIGATFGPISFSQLSSIPTSTTLIYVSDATLGSNPCSGSGTGAPAFYINGQWNCSVAGPGGVSIATSLPITGGPCSSGTCTIGVANATTSALGVIELAGDLGGSATSLTVLNGSHITNSSIPNSGLVNSSLTVNAGTGLSGGGSVVLGGSITLNLASVITAGSCTSCNLTYNAEGQITVAANGAGGGTVTGSGTNGTIPEWTSSSALGNSPITDNGTSLTSSEPFNVSSSHGGGILVLNATPSTCSGSGTTFVTVPTCYGEESGFSYPSGATGNNASGYFSNSGNATGSPNIAGVYGYAGSTSSTSATANFISGVVGQGYFNGGSTGSPTIPNISGVWGIGNAGTGQETATLIAGVEATVVDVAGLSTTVTTGAAFYANSPTITSSIISHVYGLYLADQTVGGGTDNPDPWGIYEVAGKNAFGGAMGQTAANQWGGKCTMSTTTCTVTLGVTYTTPICVAMLQGTGTVIAGECSVSGTTATVTAASSNTGTWAVVVFGDPE